ncbi:Nucleotide-binding alpha-beta plait [Penicillium cf. griseofulvum]|uniref:Nucleotide-binding alpha-beta plait n=1 Tax=Penicillium cf. griseofulvum TaxID=2972120 RepID=A0A9W9N0T5_9EURO|nr:Nucleotide-binding alpha-beta plait [Penicillium cf. griseofulvum]KAJ5422525.1 Nucleotide-binding alpha-beta plait [Penicillium cf. griseofulvum]KAJ5428702.1 Nucleotide-binding alpha-beta plait [Penicillium cf. griseofulvum]
MDFPTDVAEFDNDPRISFSKLDNSYLLETSDGREFLFNAILKRWVESIDEALIRKQQGYGSDDGETEIVHPRDRKKRKNSHDETNEPKVKKPRVNTAVWVTKIPADAELSEIRELFVKYGILAEELDTGKPRIKMYTDEHGNFNGEALVVYYRPESVDLAIRCLDETDFRMGSSNPSGPMRVQAADFSYKREKDVEPKATMSVKEKRKLKERAERLNKKLSDWGDDEAEETMKAMKAAEEARRHVILKPMFTLEELEEDPLASIEIEQDIRSECSKIGDVAKVVVWDGESQGVVTVRFVSSADARRCVQTMSGRFFAGNTVVAYIWDGEEKFKKYHPRRDAAGKMADPLDVDYEENERLERFGDWLESAENQPDKTKTEKGKNDEAKTSKENADNDGTEKDETDKTQETGKN